MHVTDRTKCAKCVLGSVVHWGHVPPGKFLISVLLGLLLVVFWGKTAKVRRSTANLVIVFGTFECSDNLKVWLCFASRCRKICFS